MYETLAIFAIFALIYSILAGGIERTWVSGAVIFTIFGLAVGPAGLGWTSLSSNAEMVSIMAELTLAVILFSDAAGADLGVLRRSPQLPLRLLLIGLPLTIVLGYGVGELLFPQVSLLEIVLLAVMLAPTDAALGKPVIANPAIPSNFREGLNIESGLNDGICVPILFVFLLLAQGEGGEYSVGWLVSKYMIEKIGIGLATGLLITAVAVVLLHFSKKHGLVSRVWMQVPVVALAISCFGVAQLLGGSGFIAAFVGGILFGVRNREHRKILLQSAEGTGNVFAMVTWVIFGALAVGPALQNLSWSVLVYSLLSLTVIRMLPVFVVLSGMKLSVEAKLFTGWFGPRGLASIVFAVVVMQAKLPHGDVLVHVVACTVILSVLLHGLSAVPWVESFGRRAS